MVNIKILKTNQSYCGPTTLSVVSTLIQYFLESHYNVEDELLWKYWIECSNKWAWQGLGVGLCEIDESWKPEQKHSALYWSESPGANLVLCNLEETNPAFSGGPSFKFFSPCTYSQFIVICCWTFFLVNIIYKVSRRGWMYYIYSAYSQNNRSVRVTNSNMKASTKNNLAREFMLWGKKGK